MPSKRNSQLKYKHRTDCNERYISIISYRSEKILCFHFIRYQQMKYSIGFLFDLVHVKIVMKTTVFHYPSKQDQYVN